MATDPGDAAYSLRELAVEAGVTPRTIHFYIQQGVLPSAGSLGSGARYSAGHLARLRLIKRLQKEHLPLGEIAGRIRALSDPEVEGLLGEAQRAPAAARSGSALDYISNVLRRSPASQEGGIGVRTRSARYAVTPPPPLAGDRSQWERVVLVPEIELHVRRPLSRARSRQLERLIENARQIFEKED